MKERKAAGEDWRIWGMCESLSLILAFQEVTRDHEHVIYPQVLQIDPLLQRASYFLVTKPSFHQRNDGEHQARVRG